MRKKLFVFLAVIAIIASGVYIYQNLAVARAYSFFAPIRFNSVASSTTSAAKSAAHAATKKIRQIFADSQFAIASSSLVDNLRAEARNVKSASFNGVKNGIDSGLNGLGNLIGVDMPAAPSSLLNQNCLK